MAKSDQVSIPNPNQLTIDSVASNLSAPGNPDDLRDPARAPVLEIPADDNAARSSAGEELQGLLRKDKSKMSPDQLKSHNDRVWELHYLTDGLQPPKR